MRRRSIELADVRHALGELDAVLLALLALPVAVAGAGTGSGTGADANPDSRARKLPFGPVLVLTTRESDGRVRRTHFWLDGSKRRERLYERGRLHGRSTAWYRNGKKRWVGEFKDGAQSGEWFYFRRDGKLDGRRTGVYEDGLRFAAMKGFNDWNA
ncbi:MAG: hypothetical protein HZA52_13980 [Planctomycetes bacterium]|nr:hypothetical protein [Planctomycetota bacterium]